MPGRGLLVGVSGPNKVSSAKGGLPLQANWQTIAGESAGDGNGGEGGQGIASGVGAAEKEALPTSSALSKRAVKAVCNGAG